MPHVFSNIRKFCSKLNEFRNTGSYTDVIIKCRDKSFNCHKVALAASCEYFDSMLGGHFKEKTSEIITLKDVSAATFEQVLEFIYSGDTLINSNNVCSLLHACEFFNLTGLEDLCIQFLKNNKLTFQNVFDVFTHACATKKKTIIDICISFIVRWFEILTNDERFCKIPFDNLEMILVKFSSLPKRNENSLINAITKWIQYNRDLRLQYSDVLIGMIDFGSIMPSSVELMYKKLLSSTDTDFLRLNNVESLGTDDQKNFEMPEQAVSKCDPNKYLHLFVKHMENNSREVLTVKNSHSLCSLRGEILQSSDDYICCVAVDDFYLYGLSFNCCNKRKVNVGKHKFCVYSSINMCSEIQLKPPPVNLYGKGTQACAIKNNIFVYHPYPLDISNQDLSMVAVTNSLSEEEIFRGIYSYNCEIDRWFSVPEMRNKFDESCMTVCYDNLYIVGGVNPSLDQSVEYGYAQAYDYREGKWRELPRSNSAFLAAACCAKDGKVYVCGGRKSKTQSERYDIAAGKWESLAPMNSPMTYHQVVSYMNLLWAMGSLDCNNKIIEDLSIQVYDSNKNEWSIYEPSLKESSQSGCIIDSIVFKSPY